MEFIYILSALYAQNSHAVVVAALIVGVALFGASIVRATSSPAAAPQRRRASDR